MSLHYVPAWPKLPPEPNAAPCGECPADCMYRDEVLALIAEPDPVVREEAASRWFCHLQPHRRCRGVARALKEATG